MVTWTMKKFESRTKYIYVLNPFLHIHGLIKSLNSTLEMTIPRIHLLEMVRMLDWQAEFLVLALVLFCFYFFGLTLLSVVGVHLKQIFL